MKLSILIATLGKREKSFRGLIDSLSPQIERYAPETIEVIAYWNNGEASIGSIRQELLEEATGNYVCFIDDDDGIPIWYCEEILGNLGKDYIGFEVQLFNDGRLMPRVFHSIRYGIWHQDDTGYYRGVTHLNPIKRKIALLGEFSTRGSGEDEDWSRAVTPHVRTENYIDRIMYYYHHSSENSNFGGSDNKQYKGKRPEIERSFFRWHPRSKK